MLPLLVDLFINLSMQLLSANCEGCGLHIRVQSLLRMHVQFRESIMQ